MDVLQTDQKCALTAQKSFEDKRVKRRVQQRNKRHCKTKQKLVVAGTRKKGKVAVSCGHGGSGVVIYTFNVDCYNLSKLSHVARLI